MPKNSGRIRTATVWKTNVLKKDISAEVNPSLSAVKNPEVKIANPINKKHSANNLNPETVSSSSSGERPTKILHKGSASSWEISTIEVPTTAISLRLLASSERSSVLFFAPKWNPNTGAVPVE